MVDFNWKNEIKLWVEKNRNIKEYSLDIILLFLKAFQNNLNNKKSFFGANTSSISVVGLDLYMVAYYKPKKSIWIMLDKELPGIANVSYVPVTDPSLKSKSLFWLVTTNLSMINKLIENKEVWNSYKRASKKLFSTASFLSHKPHVIKNKLLVSDFFNDTKNTSKIQTKAKNLKKSNCPFCYPESGKELVLESATAFAILDKFPVSNGHTLIIPKKHCANYFDLTNEEQKACWRMVNETQEIIRRKFNPDGFNIGINVNETAGQTIPHVHIHLIPRYKGDVINPEGGIRGVIPSKAIYKNL